MEEACLNNEAVFDHESNEYGVVGASGSSKNGHVADDDSPTKPSIGLEFDSLDEAYDFYNAYARERGFGVRVSNSWFRSKRRDRYRAKLSCSSAGFKKNTGARNPRPETRTGCPAMVVVREVESSRWRIVDARLDHNHHVSPLIKRFYKSHKRMVIDNTSQLAPETEVHTIRLYRADSGLDHRCRDHCCFRSQSQSEYLDLREGDSSALYNYFCRMKLTDPGFFYLMDVDDEDGRLRNVFWAGACSRAAYWYFNDAVAIDTTCIVSKFQIPLVSFIGVNHHGESVLLGCGFLGSESAECFVWMLRTWMKCMMGRTPRVIVTDQSKPLEAAVAEVIPDTRHCYSSWYITQRVAEKLGGLKGYEAIRRQLHLAVYDSLKISEFETCWVDMVTRHGLVDNKWLQTLYEERRRWVPVYLKDVFFAGTIPIRENEGATAFFDGYVHKHTSFKEFVDKYDLALHRKRAREFAADQESRNPNPELKTRCNFESQISKAYTKEMFRRFRSEVEGMQSCFDTRRGSANGAIATYVVKERVGGGKVKCFEVLYETTQVDIRCICSLFNYKGYLCRHALSVLSYNRVDEIPARYDLPRWSRDFKCRYMIDQETSTSSTELCDSLYWYNHLNNLALPLVEEGAKSEERYNTALQELEALLKKFDIVDDDDNNLSVT